MSVGDTLLDYIEQQQRREDQLLSNVLKAFEKHKQETQKDLEVLKRNLKRAQNSEKAKDKEKKDEPQN